MAKKFTRNFRIWRGEIIEVLVKDDPGKLGRCFTWSSTPQGRQYWADRTAKGVEWTEEDKIFLRNCLRTSHPNDID